MNILILGADGRAHALSLAYAKNQKVKKILVVPGNGLIDYTNKKAHIYPEISVLDFEKILALCKKEKVDFVDVAPDDPLSKGFVDQFEKEGITAFGPSKNASQLEWSKAWARDFMQKYHLPIPDFQTFSDQKKAIAYINSKPHQTLYIKASGLALGKGAVRAENKEEAITAIKSMKQFGKSGETFLIEECLIGEEFSLFAICDGENYKVVKSAQDHKTIYNKDKGPNTGGVGCVAPSSLITKKQIQEFETKIVKPILTNMKKEGRPYKGLLYLNGMLTHSKISGQAKKEIKIIEFNCRWGDPEAEVIVPSLTTDYLKIALAVTQQKLKNSPLILDNKTRISITGCAQGYPGDIEKVKGKEIFGLLEALKLPGITIFGAGIKRTGKRFFVNGGRIFHVMAEGKDIPSARRLAYDAMSRIFIEGNNLHYRTDIGWRELERAYQ